MKNRCYVGGLLALVFLVGLMAVLTVPLTEEATAAAPVTLEVFNPTGAATPVTLTVYNPTGAFAVTQTFAPRLSDLNGKIICEVTDAAWEADRTFPAIRQLLQRQFPAAKIVPFNEVFPAKAATDIDTDKITDAVKAKGCQAAIVGNAG